MVKDQGDRDEVVDAATLYRGQGRPEKVAGAKDTSPVCLEEGLCTCKSPEVQKP